MGLVRDRPALVLGALVVISWALVAGALAFFRPSSAPRPAPSAGQRGLLSAVPTHEVYGSGEGVGVTVPKSGEVQFVYRVVHADEEPAAYVQFVARGLARDDQVEVRVDDKPVGYAKALKGPQRLDVPPGPPANGGLNVLVFRNTAGAQSRPWSIGRVCVLSRGDGARLGKETLARARAHLDSKGEKLDNRQIAWNELLDATYYLAAEDSEQPLFVEAKARLDELEGEIGALCEKAIIVSSKLEAHHDVAGARAEYETALRFFPAGDHPHPCRERLLQHRADGLARPASHPTE